MAAGRATYWIGPAGWSYADWVGIVYPGRRALERPAKRPSAREAPHGEQRAAGFDGPERRPRAPVFPRGFKPLQFLSQYFNCVEVNSTFYRIPSPAAAEGWVLQTPADFRFTLKVPRSFTHKRADAPALAEVEAFRAVLKPIADAGKLGPILLQFPWSFRFMPAATDWLERLAELFGDVERFIEVRHASWDCEAGLAVVRRTGGWCNIDQPRLNDCLTGTGHVFGRDAYLRLHGRNRRNWFAKDLPSFERYNYLYTEQELREWVARLNEMAEQAQNVYVVTNNHYGGQSVVNALELKALLGGRKVIAPAGLSREFPELAPLLTEPPAPQPVQGELFGAN